uniref:PE-PGRS family protein n=1 Tax=Streptomyces sp. NBC_01401 TaxID=2903854 RepID=A0AAU3GLN7_9ACTN
MEAGPVGRAVRAAMFAVVSVTLAATGHVLMSGAPLPFWVPATGFLALAVPGWWFAARERGPWLVTGLAVVTQGVLHNAFSAAQSALGTVPGTATRAVGGAAAPRMDAMAGMHHMAHTDHSATSDSMAGMEHMVGMERVAGMDHVVGMDHSSAVDHMGHLSSMAHTGHGMAGMSPGMLAAHVLAALVCGVWMARGERAAFQTLRAVAGLLLAPLRPLLTAALPAPRRRLRPRRGLSDRLSPGLRCARALDRRGPPGVLAAS